MTVSGNLAFQSGALYLVQVNPATASIANVTGTATLAGNVLAAFAPALYGDTTTSCIGRGLGGTTFNGRHRPPAGRLPARLGYTATDVSSTSPLPRWRHHPQPAQPQSAGSPTRSTNNLQPRRRAAAELLPCSASPAAIDQHADAVAGEAATGAEQGAST